jgi:P-type E1-E2 ATPase
MYIGVEIIRLIQSPILKYDKYVFDSINNKPSIARTSSLPDELGQINFILSDKTGTLTKNNMILEKISICDKVYTINNLEGFFHQKFNLEDSSSNNIEKHNSNEIITNELSDSFKGQSNFITKEEPFVYEEIHKDIINFEESIVDFFRLINICNSIVIDYKNSKVQNEANYQVTFY